MKKLITHVREGIYYGGKIFVLLELMTVITIISILVVIATEIVI